MWNTLCARIHAYIEVGMGSRRNLSGKNLRNSRTEILITSGRVGFSGLGPFEYTTHMNEGS